MLQRYETDTKSLETNKGKVEFYNGQIITPDTLSIIVPEEYNGKTVFKLTIFKDCKPVYENRYGKMRYAEQANTFLINRYDLLFDKKQ